MSDFTKWVEAWDAYRNAGLPVQGSIANCLCLLGAIGIAVSIPLALSQFAYPKFGTPTVISIVSFILGVASLAASFHMPDHYGTAPEPDELGTRIVRIWGLESIDCDGNLPQRRLPHPTSNAPSTGTTGASASPSTRTTATGSACTTRMAKR